MIAKEMEGLRVVYCFRSIPSITSQVAKQWLPNSTFILLHLYNCTSLFSFPSVKWCCHMTFLTFFSNKTRCLDSMILVLNSTHCLHYDQSSTPGFLEAGISFCFYLTVLFFSHNSHSRESLRLPYLQQLLGPRISLLSAIPIADACSEKVEPPI